MWSNFHTHSSYCDGKEKPVHYVNSALSQNIKSLGFSSHAPLPFECKWSMKEDHLDGYLAEIDSLKAATPELEIYKGLEIDFIPDIISPSKFRDKLDYSIGSIHFVEKLSNGRHWEIDGPHALFSDGLNDIFKNKIKDAVVRYFELTREMVQHDCPSIIGHLDKIKIQNTDNKLFSETDSWYRTAILKTLRCIEESGTIVEVNTRGIYQQRSHTTYPSPWILEVINEKNIPITLSTDAHHPFDIVNQLAQTARMLSKLGFKKIMALKNGEWTQFNFNEYGIAFS